MLILTTEAVFKVLKPRKLINQNGYFYFGILKNTSIFPLYPLPEQRFSNYIGENSYCYQSEPVVSEIP